jgi:hypothetical protein
LDFIGTSLQQNPQQTPTKDPQTINDLLQSMDDKFLRGGIGGFLKTAAKKPSPEAQKQIRIGLTLVIFD